MELVYMDGKKEPYTLSSIVAECTGLQHHTITKTIRKHKQDLNSSERLDLKSKLWRVARIPRTIF